jgi:hypothetical protein
MPQSSSRPDPGPCRPFWLSRGLALGLQTAPARLVSPAQAGRRGPVVTRMDPARSAAEALVSGSFHGCGRRLGSIYWRRREALVQAPAHPSPMTPTFSSSDTAAGSGGRVRLVRPGHVEPWVLTGPRRALVRSSSCRPDVVFFTRSTHDSVKDALDPLRGDPLEGDPLGPGRSTRIGPDRARGSKVQIRRNPARPGAKPVEGPVS